MDLRPRYLAIAAALHALLFTLLILSAFFQRPIEQLEVMTAVLMPPPPPPPPPAPEPPKPKPKPPEPKPPEPKPPEPKPPEPTPEERVADVLKKLNCETIADMQREAGMRVGAEREILRSRIADMEAKCRKKEEDKKKEEERLKKIEEDRVKKELEDKKKEEERLKKLEDERLKKEEEARKKEEERLRKEEEKRLKEQERLRKIDMENMLEQERQEREYADQQRRQAALEAAAIAEANARADAAANKALSDWAALVSQKVRRNWSRPPNLSQDLLAKVQIVMLPTGDIANVKIVQSSGNPVYDDSVEKAIRKSSPLPKLADPRAYAKARDLILKFTPRDLEQR